MARKPLARLKERLVISGRQKFASRSQLKLIIEGMLDGGLPRAYARGLYKQKCSALSEGTQE